MSFIAEVLSLCLGGLEQKVRELYSVVCRLEEEKYDWEGRLGRQTEEVVFMTTLSLLVFQCLFQRPSVEATGTFAPTTVAAVSLRTNYVNSCSAYKYNYAARRSLADVVYYFSSDFLDQRTQH